MTVQTQRIDPSSFRGSIIDSWPGISDLRFVLLNENSALLSEVGMPFPLGIAEGISLLVEQVQQIVGGVINAFNLHLLDDSIEVSEISFEM